ncbi:rod shape-determining protein MreC [Horticoccus luteus]|uniref:Cell shape-determining protein MreC n=1 Tax=Horticoccus luteus TaxID=2862869 RepID=A0A8F9TYZ2_9BACT|nr:rod shape-determining protein MreC [Horticoccus luteus]
MLPVAVKSFLRASFFEFQAPLPLATSYVRDLQEYWGLRAHSNDELIGAGRDLARVLSSYEFAVQQNTELRDQVDRLDALLALPPMPNFRYEHARVVSRDSAGWWQRLTIRKGRNYNIPLGAPVVFSGGIVGRIAEVHAFTSVVEMVSSPTFRIAATVQGDTRPMSYQGTVNHAFGTAEGTVEFVPVDIFANASAPQHLVTSGLGGVFPPGLYLGTVTKLEPSTDGLFKSGEVDLDPRLDALTEVTVLVPQPAP